MRIALFGATGMTGREVLDVALREGHHVSVLVRDPTALPPETTCRSWSAMPLNRSPSVSAWQAPTPCCPASGSAAGATVVPPRSCPPPPEPSSKQMQHHGVDRLVVMSNVGASGSGSWLARRVVYPLFIRWIVPIIDDKTRMERALAASDLTWTSVRLPDITTGGQKPPHISTDGRRLRPWVSVATTARFLLDTVATGAFPRQAPAISH
jgi:hypothetical protein